MKAVVVRLGLYGLIALALFAALRYTPPLPDPDVKAADVLAEQQGTPMWKLRQETIRRGESLSAFLVRLGLSSGDVQQAVAATQTTVDPRRLPADAHVVIRSAPTDSVPSEISIPLGGNRVFTLRRNGAEWAGTADTVAAKTDTIIVSGTIAQGSNLYRAVDAGAGDGLPKEARNALTATLADVYAYRVDMSRDLHNGDAFTVAAERAVDESGTVHIRNVVAATFSLSGKVIDAIRFHAGSGADEYFDQFGKSMRTAFLKAPLKFKYISSGFGMRLHPILGIMREHKGLDYAAASGTPVEAVGDGVISRIGWAGGYGNMIELRHPNGIVTRYGHMRAFAHGLHEGSRVEQGNVIGFVGATGLATGPHLHFEVLVNGVSRPPSTALPSVPSEPVPAADEATFDSLRDLLIASIQSPGQGVTRLAFH